MTKLLLTLLGLCFIAILIFTPFVSNLWCVVTDREFRIPDESTLITFKVTKMNQGSGSWWTAAEDQNYYFAYSESDQYRYHAFPKTKVLECKGFINLSPETWCQDFKISPLNTTSK